MTTSRRLPPGPPPAPDGLERAFAEARRRRLRTLGTASVTPVLAGVLLLALLPGAGSRFTLTPVEPASTGSADPSAEPSADPTPAGSESPSAGPSQRPSGGPVPGVTPVPDPWPRSTASPSPYPRPTDDPALPDDPPAPAYAMERATHPETTPTSCATEGVAEWCVRSYYDTSSQTHPALGFALCRGSADTDRLTFTYGQEVDLVVVDASGSERWRWSNSYAVPAEAHTVAFPRFGCVEWWTRWDGVSDAGDPLPPGNYRLRVSVFADETPGVRDVERHIAL